MSKLESATQFQGALDKLNNQRLSAKVKKDSVSAIVEDTKEEEPDKPPSDEKQSQGSESDEKEVKEGVEI